MQNKKDWLNNFIEKNAWGLLVALIGVAVAYAILNSEVKAQDKRINTIEAAQIMIVENQKDIIELQTNQTNDSKAIGEIKTDIGEIKSDIKDIIKK